MVKWIYFHNFKCMRTRILLLLILVSLSISTSAQSWLWAQRLHYQFSAAMTVDNKGNIFVTGQIDTGLIISPYPLPNHGTFITKFTASGDTIWTKTFDGGRPQTIVVDESGHVFVGGTYFDSVLVWNGHVVRNASPYSTWASFLAMFDTLGNCVWIRGDSSLSNSGVSNVAVGPSGNIYLSGGAFGVAKFNHITLPHHGSNYNAFLVKYNIFGDVIWAVSGTAGYGMSLAIDKSENIYQSGNLIESEISFGSVTCTPDPVPGAMYGGYIARFDSNGHAIWIRGRKNNVSSSYWHVAVDEYGSAFEVNSYDKEHIIGVDTMKVVSGGVNMELVKYSSSGEILSAKSAGGIEFVIPRDICTDKWGNIFVSGSVSPGGTTDSVHFDNISLSCIPYSVPFVVKYNKCGEVVYATVLGNSIRNNGDIRNIFSTDSNLYVLGLYSNYGISIGETALTNTYKTYDCFLAKLSGTGGGSDCWPMTVAEVSDSEQLSLFPNPSNSTIVINYCNDIYSITVYNTLGQKVSSQTYKGRREIELDVSRWSHGFYFIQINNIIMKRFLKI